MSGPREFELKLEFEPDKAEIIRRHPAVARVDSDTHTENSNVCLF